MPAPDPNAHTYLTVHAYHQLVPHWLLTTDHPGPAQARNLYLNRARAHLINDAAAIDRILAGPVAEHWEPAWRIGQDEDTQLVAADWARHALLGLDVEGPLPTPTVWSVRYAVFTVERALAN